MKRGLIVEITDGDGFYYRGNLYYDLTKVNAIRLAMIFAAELRKKHIASVAMPPGFLRSEAVLESLKVTEANWRDAIKRRPEFAESETPYFVGRAIAALAADPQVIKKSGRVFNSAELARIRVQGCRRTTAEHLELHLGNHAPLTLQENRRRLLLVLQHDFDAWEKELKKFQKEARAGKWRNDRSSAARLDAGNLRALTKANLLR